MQKCDDVKGKPRQKLLGSSLLNPMVKWVQARFGKRGSDCMGAQARTLISLFKNVLLLSVMFGKRFISGSLNLHPRRRALQIIDLEGA